MRWREFEALRAPERAEHPIEQAIDREVGELGFDLHDQFQAKKAFDAAMADAKGEFEPIVKKAVVKVRDDTCVPDRG